jgi:hypothetical protein
VAELDSQSHLLGHQMTPQERTELEQAQRIRLREINVEPGSRQDAESRHGQVWDSEELRRDFEVLAFCAPWTVVKRRADGVTGSLEFQHVPRLYWGFQEDRGQ